MNQEKIIRDVEALGINMLDLAIRKDGEELYHKFQKCANCMNGYSVTKSFTMTAIGILQDDGVLHVEDKALPWLQEEYSGPLDPNWQDVTIEHLILHTTGFDADWCDIDTQDVNAFGTKDYLAWIMSKPLPHKPGEVYKYTDAGYYLLSRIASKAAGEEMSAFLQRHMIDDLNFHEIAWSRCPKGYAIGATGLYSRADDTAAFAQLYLNGGMLDGKRILSQEWVDRVIEKQYEFHRVGESGLYVKGGMYGQGVGFHLTEDFTVSWHSMQLNKDDQDNLKNYLAELKL